MALRAAIARFLPLSKSQFNLHSPSSIPLLHRLFFNYTISISSAPSSSTARSFCNSSDNPRPRNSKLVNFSLPSDSDSDADTEPPPQQQKPDKSKLPPPYNPFDKKQAAVEEPEDPTNLQEVFAKIRGDGLMSSAVKMFDGLSQEGLTHEALELFSQIKDKGQMPDVVAHTAVMEAYANAGQAKEAHKVYLRMLASRVLPNAYTYRVIIRGLAGSGNARLVKEAGKYVWEMVGRGMRPNAEAVVAAFEGLAKVAMEEEGRAMLEMVKEKGLVPEESKVRDAVKGKRGVVYRTVMDVFFGHENRNL